MGLGMGWVDSNLSRRSCYELITPTVGKKVANFMIFIKEILRMGMLTVFEISTIFSHGQRGYYHVFSLRKSYLRILRIGLEAK